jgi:uncharacterized protein (TIGR02001 family)
MRRILEGIVIAGVLVSGLTPGSALADGHEAEITANVGVYSKYMWRGWNLNDDISVQGGIDLAYGQFYAGIWGGTDETLGTEIDYYAGVSHRFHEYLSLEVGFIQYRFDHHSIEQDEVHVTADFSLFSLSYHDGEADYDYIEANTSFELTATLSLDLHYGVEDNDVRDWYDYSARLNYTINDKYSLFLAASDKEDNDDEIYAGLIGNF